MERVLTAAREKGAGLRSRAGASVAVKCITREIYFYRKMSFNRVGGKYASAGLDSTHAKGTRGGINEIDSSVNRTGFNWVRGKTLTTFLWTSSMGGGIYPNFYTRWSGEPSHITP